MSREETKSPDPFPISNDDDADAGAKPVDFNAWLVEQENVTMKMALPISANSRKTLQFPLEKRAVPTAGILDSGGFSIILTHQNTDTT